VADANCVTIQGVATPRRTRSSGASGSAKGRKAGGKRKSRCRQNAWNRGRTTGGRCAGP